MSSKNDFLSGDELESLRKEIVTLAASEDRKADAGEEVAVVDELPQSRRLAGLFPGFHFTFPPTARFIRLSELNSSRFSSPVTRPSHTTTIRSEIPMISGNSEEIMTTAFPS